MLKPTKTHETYNHALFDRSNMPVVAYGSAGTGKTYGAAGRAVEWLKGGGNKSRVVFCRPNVSFADTNGYLPGSEREKLGPWIRPLQDNLAAHGFNQGMQESAENNGNLIYTMLEHVQGRTFDNTLVVVDEVQNTTFEQLKVLVTRLGVHSKLVLCGDIAQTSPKFRNSGLKRFIDMVIEQDLPVHTIEFKPEDIMRSEQCKMFILAFEKEEQNDSAN